MATTRDPNEISQDSQRSGRSGQSAVTGETGMSRQASEGIGSTISNEAYNIISALHAKCEGLEAYRKYSRDGDQRIWKELSQRDNEAVRLLCDELEKLVRDGRLRMGQPGKSAH